MIAIWNNGGEYSDESIWFLTLDPLTVDEFRELNQRWAARKGYCPPFIMAVLDSITLEPNSRYSVQPLSEWLKESGGYWDFEQAYKDDERFRELAIKAGFVMPEWWSLK